MTKRVPGAKRGRPKKQELPKRPRREAGRPGRQLCTRPYRYALAYYEALASIPVSRRMAMFVAHAAYNGGLLTMEADGSPNVVAAPQGYVNPLHAARAAAAIAAEPDPFKLVDEDFDKHRERCREIAKWHAKQPDDLAWLRSMSRAIRIATGPWSADASENVLALAEAADEVAWARRVLLPMLDRKQALAA
jgi:hypothetical protein